MDGVAEGVLEGALEETLDEALEGVLECALADMLEGAKLLCLDRGLCNETFSNSTEVPTDIASLG